MNQLNNDMLEKKLYEILVITGCVANAVGFLANAFLYGLSTGTLTCGVCALVLLCAGLIGHTSKYRRKAEFVILFIISFIEFPFLYYVYGRSTFVYMILGIVGTATFMSGKKRQMMLVFEILFDVSIILLSYFYPVSGTITEENSIGSAICSYVIVAVSVGAMLTLLVNQYEKQQKELIALGIELEQMARIDPLTEVYNRLYLTEYISERLSDPQACFAIVLLDIDNFKQVNDEYGHVYGDEVLKTLASTLKTNMQGYGITARFGGEEFMLVFETAERERIEDIMERSALELKTFSMETRKIEITFSGGVEEVHNEKRITSMFNAADEKLYLAKRTGKNKVIFEK